MLSDDACRAAARQWIAWDPNADTKCQVQQALDADDLATLQGYFSHRLAFGTAGLRAKMAPGTTAMNDLVVVQTTQGLCQYLLHVFGDDAKKQGVVFGYDHRAKDSLSSKRFAQLGAAVCVHLGLKVYLYEGLVATPMVPFAIETLGCVAGVMVTASHNPKADNGYKVYWNNASQIIPPHDAAIAAQIEQHLEPYTDYNALIAMLDKSPLVENPTQDIIAKYFAKLGQTLCRHPEDNANSKMPITYTAMHGVGYAFAKRGFEAFHLPPFVPTKEQVEPDPEFPTVAFPNPEEGKSALHLAMATARAHNSRLILANDPDADRLAVAEFDVETEQWKVFTGNEIGALLGHWELTQYLAKHPDADRSQLYFVASTVSSKMLQAVAEVEHVNFVETLTGFKWMGNKTAELREQGKTVLLSFEEAIGFCVGDLVKDKDGISAAAVFAEMAIQLDKQYHRTVTQHLAFLSERYGQFLSSNHCVICDDPALIQQIFARLRNDGQYWTKCGAYEIQHIRDLTAGYDSEQPDCRPVLPVSASTQMITYKFSNGCVATLRTSGTEPKIKCYCELRGKIGQSRAEVDAILQDQVREIIDGMLQPTLHNLSWS